MFKADSQTATLSEDDNVGQSPATEPPHPSNPLPRERHPRLRFKSKRLYDEEAHDVSSSRLQERIDVDSERSDRRHGQRKHHHQRKRRRRQDEHSPSDSGPHIDADVAFRESLFDAMADDEGAEYWEGVYGQPIHNFSNVRQAAEKGELERMGEDEYVEYVRAKMWEKSHQHIIEERAKRDEELKRRREARRTTDQKYEERDAFDRAMEESLRKGAERQTRKGWKEAWDKYNAKWKDLLDPGHKDQPDVPWPVKSGRTRDIGKKHVEEFFEHCQDFAEDCNSLQALLKIERIRWHPDKMLQRFGTRDMDEETRRAVTAVFQIIDELYTLRRQP